MAKVNKEKYCPCRNLIITYTNLNKHTMLSNHFPYHCAYYTLPEESLEFSGGACRIQLDNWALMINLVTMATSRWLAAIRPSQAPASGGKTVEYVMLFKRGTAWRLIKPERAESQPASKLQMSSTDPYAKEDAPVNKQNCTACSLLFFAQRHKLFVRRWRAEGGGAAGDS